MTDDLFFIISLTYSTLLFVLSSFFPNKYPKDRVIIGVNTAQDSFV